MSALARRFRCTEGQVATAGIGFALAVALLLIGIPPVLRDRPLAAAPSAPSSPVAPSPPTTAPPTSMRSTSTTRPTTAVAPTAPPSGPAPGGAPGEAAEGGSPRALPRSVVDSGYTSSTSGTPLSGPEVPDDGMPVGVRLGQIDKVSFARLAGTAPELHLTLVDDPAANQLVALAAVQVCAVTEPGWVLDRPGAAPDDAPAYDSDRCSQGIQDPDGTWTFDLSGLGTIDDRAGIALLPVFEGPSTFQVTFSTVVAGVEQAR